MSEENQSQDQKQEQAPRDLSVDDQLRDLRLDHAAQSDRITELEEKIKSLLQRFIHPSEL